jgi:porin
MSGDDARDAVALPSIVLALGVWTTSAMTACSSAPSVAATRACTTERTPRESPVARAETEEESGSAAWPFGEHATGEWRGLRRRLEDEGVTLDAFWVADASRSFRGGLDTEAAVFRSLLDARLTFDLERLVGWEGGRVLVGFQTQDGRHGSDRLVGDFQGFSNIDAAGFTALTQLWHEQVLLDGGLRTKIGKIDATEEFAFVDNGADFIHSSAGFSPTIVGFPTYPDPATGVVVVASPTHWLSLGTGVFDGATQAGMPTGTRGPATFLGGPADLFWVAEATAQWSSRSGRDGRIGLGVSHHTSTFEVLDGSGRTEDGATSAYLVLDQAVTPQGAPGGEGQGIGVFLQLGRTEEDVSEIDLHVGAGVVWRGAIPGRDRDSLGLMGSYVRFSDTVRSAGSVVEDHELAIEGFYDLRVTEWLSLKPDLQFIRNPGGREGDDAIVGTLRIVVDF